MLKDLYGKPVLFAVVATVTILVGTIATMFVPMLTQGMHPRLDALQPLTALELAGRDIYQREGCNNCHTQTVRPLKTEVMRYGEYSKAGEFAYDRPFLWGSKRTGPDLARIGGKYNDKWHYRHFDDPRAFYPKSNMPAYGWLKDNKLDADEIRSHMDALDLPYTDDDLKALAEHNELDALVAYMQWLGSSVKKSAPKQEPPKGEGLTLDASNPKGGDAAAIDAGKQIFADICAECHGDNGEGDIGPALDDTAFLYKPDNVADGLYFVVIHDGTEQGFAVEGYTPEGGMPAYGNTLDTDKIWSVIAFIRSLQGAKAE